MFNHPDVATEINAENINRLIQHAHLVTDESDLRSILIDLKCVDLSDEAKNNFSEYIRNNPQLLRELYDSFLQECEKQGLLSENPMLYQGSLEQLIENEKQESIDITDEIRALLEKCTATDIFNAYFNDLNKSQLSPESRIEIIKSIISKEVTAREIESAIIDDLDILCEAGLISDELYDDIDSTLCPVDRRNYLLVNSFLSLRKSASLDKFSKTSSLYRELRASSNSLSPEQIKQKIDERRLEFIEYFSTPIESPEKKQQRIELLRNMIEQFKLDRTFPYEIMSILEAELQLLESDIEQIPEKISVRSQICSELASKNIDSINTEDVLKYVNPVQR